MEMAKDVLECDSVGVLEKVIYHGLRESVGFLRVRDLIDIKKVLKKIVQSGKRHHLSVKIDIVYAVVDPRVETKY